MASVSSRLSVASVSLGGTADKYAQARSRSSAWAMNVGVDGWNPAQGARQMHRQVTLIDVSSIRLN